VKCQRNASEKSVSYPIWLDTWVVLTLCWALRVAAAQWGMECLVSSVFSRVMPSYTALYRNRYWPCNNNARRDDVERHNL
jgi:hypothetical protein